MKIIAPVWHVMLLICTLAGFTAQAQQKTADSSKKVGDVMTQMLDYSRPGKYHAILGKLAGTWHFQDAKLSFVKGTLIRKPIYNGRFYMIEITGGKLKVPVADGQMKEEAYQGMQIEGYDNPAAKYVTVSINNHIGSDIQEETGDYDAAKKQFTYVSETELIAGTKEKNKRILKIIDENHYIEEYYQQQDGKDVKVRELDYTKTGD
ncbi:DUF1579 family protein [Mucilaginibacter sp. CAU 1740]|uniref:DUF1579 family protein n=1 Tax=Mucilaginibacter sp. CAU 1740 TaxID=3140365 RepID=UPI00325BDA24